MGVKAPRGTEDLLGESAIAWEKMQATAKDVFSRYGYSLVSTPMFEEQSVFVRGIGEGTDVVDKEMFHVLSNDAFDKVSHGETLKSNQNLSLRPEGTAGVVRCAIEHNLVPQGGPVSKLMYAGSMFRCERPQKGRLREFHQIGAECLGAEDPSADAEMIIMLLRFFEAMGVRSDNIRVLINSMGDDNCRPAYRDMIRDYIHEHSDELCEDCNRRAEINPLRAFDCKVEHDAEVMSKAPKISDHLCGDCREHYETVKRYLDLAGVSYVEDPRLVRGLDYYTRTVFEIQVIDGLGSQNAIGGGGRYDKLMEVMGGSPTPGIGFALGYERTLLALEAAGVTFEADSLCDVYVAVVDKSCADIAFSIVQRLRDSGVKAEQDHQGRSLKSQFKQAGKSGCKLTVVVGPDEVSSGNVTLRKMDLHEESKVSIDSVVDEVKSIL
ncbi:MAG: histidine--tRNA ligase [Coriobacteriales bacterium]|jgi:histidyl-tRNA synthetase